MTTDTVGGVWTFTIDLAQALYKRGFQVWLAAMGGPANDSQQREAGLIPGLRLFDSAYKLEWMENPWDDVAESGRWLLGLAAQCEPEIVHLNSFGHAALPWRVPVVLTAHSCVATWWKAVKGENLPREWNRYRREVARALESADAVTVPSGAMAHSLCEQYGIGAEKVRVVYNGRNASGFRSGPKRDMILAAGRLWDEGKNIALLARIAPELPWPVYVAGCESDPAGHAAALSGCHPLGQLSPDELAGWYSRASVYVLPARYEPFGYSPVEAALSGCALVLGDIPSLREIWRDAAMFVPPGDSLALKQMICELISDKPLREKMARRACARAGAFTPERMAGSYIRIYDGVAARRLACAS